MIEFDFNNMPKDLGDYVITTKMPRNRTFKKYVIAELRFNQVTCNNEFYNNDTVIPPRFIESYYKLKTKQAD